MEWKKYIILRNSLYFIFITLFCLFYYLSQNKSIVPHPGCSKILKRKSVSNGKHKLIYACVCVCLLNVSLHFLTQLRKTLGYN